MQRQALTFLSLIALFLLTDYVAKAQQTQMPAHSKGDLPDLTQRFLTATSVPNKPVMKLQNGAATPCSMPHQEITFSWENNAWREDSTLWYMYDQMAGITEELVRIGGQEKRRTLTTYFFPGGPIKDVTY